LPRYSTLKSEPEAAFGVVQKLLPPSVVGTERPAHRGSAGRAPWGGHHATVAGCQPVVSRPYRRWEVIGTLIGGPVRTKGHWPDRQGRPADAGAARCVAGQNATGMSTRRQAPIGLIWHAYTAK